MANFFSTDAFLNAVGETLYPDAANEIAVIEVEGIPFRVLKSNGRYRVNIPWLDFLEPEPPALHPVKEIDYIPRVCLENISPESWQDNPPEKREASPWTDWRKFSSWREYVDFAHQRNPRAFCSRNAYKLRKMDRQVGQTTFEFYARDRTVLE